MLNSGSIVVSENIMPGYAGVEPHHPDDSYSTRPHHQISKPVLFSISYCSQIKDSTYKTCIYPNTSAPPHTYTHTHSHTNKLKKQSLRNHCTTWLFFFKRFKCFPYCGILNGCRKCCHSTLLSKLPQWGFGSGRCQCGRFQNRPTLLRFRFAGGSLISLLCTLCFAFVSDWADFKSCTNVFAWLF